MHDGWSGLRLYDGADLNLSLKGAFFLFCSLFFVVSSGSCIMVFPPDSHFGSFYPCLGLLKFRGKVLSDAFAIKSKINFINDFVFNLSVV